MNTQNLDYLKNNLKYFGFGERLNAELESNIKVHKNDFKLNCEIPHFSNKMNFTLHFKKSEATDLYFFNKYDAVLDNGKPELNKIQSFYINKGNGITAKEAFNLLEGRSVQKDLVNKNGEKYKAWLKIDFDVLDNKGGFKLQQFSEKYGYNLEKNLSQYPIKELEDPEQKHNLMNSLEKGNLQQVSVKTGDKETKFYIEAVPQYKNINVYDSKMKSVKRQNIQKSEELTDSTRIQSVSKRKEEGKLEEPTKERGRKKKMSM